MKVTRARVLLRRRDDPANEYRRLVVVMEDANLILWHGVGFANEPNIFSDALSNIGSEHAIREKLRQTIKRPCDEEGFTVFRSEGETFLNG